MTREEIEQRMRILAEEMDSLEDELSWIEAEYDKLGDLLEEMTDI